MTIREGDEEFELFVVDSWGRMLSGAHLPESRLKRTDVPKNEWYKPKWMRDVKTAEE